MHHHAAEWYPHIAIVGVFTPADTNYQGNSILLSPFVVNRLVPATSLVTFNASTPHTYGTAVTFNATVTAVTGGVTPTGTVSFYVGGTTLLCVANIALISGVATCMPLPVLTGGTYSLSFDYVGDVNYLASTSAPVSLTVNKKAPVLPRITSNLASSQPYGMSSSSPSRCRRR